MWSLGSICLLLIPNPRDHLSVCLAVPGEFTKHKPLKVGVIVCQTPPISQETNMLKLAHLVGPKFLIFAATEWLVLFETAMEMH